MAYSKEEIEAMDVATLRKLAFAFGRKQLNSFGAQCPMEMDNAFECRQFKESLERETLWSKEKRRRFFRCECDCTGCEMEYFLWKIERGEQGNGIDKRAD